MIRQSIITVILTGAALTVSAQGLHQEVEVEREITPVERQASKPALLPVISLPKLEKVNLPFSNRMVTTSVTPSFTTLEPASTSAGLFTDDFRGYLRLGVFPIYNAGLAAGYKLADTDRTRLNVWVNYTGHVYRRDIPETSDRRYWRDNRVTAAADLHQAIGSKGMLDADVNYTYARYNMWHKPLPGISPIHNQWANRFDADVAYRSRAEGLSYSVKAGFERFSFGLRDVDGAAQSRFNLGFDGGLQAGHLSEFAVGVDAVLLHSGLGGQSSQTGLITLNPRYTYHTADHRFSARIGLAADISINDGSVFRIAPDLMAAWNPSSFFGVELKAAGGTVMNTLSSLFDLTPYCIPTVWYSNSSIPVDFTAKIVVGPFRGAYLELEGGYARANDWLMPLDGFTPQGEGVYFSGNDMKAWHGSAALGWNSRYVSVRTSCLFSPSSLDKAYYINRDRAAYVFDASVSVRPVKSLEIKAGYSLRACRAAYGYDRYDFSEGMTVFTPVRRNLGNAADLSLEANYSITPKVSAFVTASNLLNRSYLLLGDRPAQGLTALVGVEFKF